MTGRVVVLTGGVGGAKLVLGLCHAVPPKTVTAIVNTGDDFTHFGLSVSPDIDTLLYTLSGKANAAHGWGREGESLNFMDALRSLGGEDWFLLGDGDLALHVLRSERLRNSETLSNIIADFATAWGIGASILPMSDDSVATRVDTEEGLLDFQQFKDGKGHGRRGRWIQCLLWPRTYSLTMEAIWIPKSSAPIILGATRPADLFPPLLHYIGRYRSGYALAARAP